MALDYYDKQGNKVGGETKDGKPPKGAAFQVGSDDPIAELTIRGIKSKADEEAKDTNEAAVQSDLDDSVATSGTATGETRPLVATTRTDKK